MSSSTFLSEQILHSQVGFRFILGGNKMNEGKTQEKEYNKDNWTRRSSQKSAIGKVIART
jgi:hypothetical protein